jgi:hypothetical protein
MRIVLNVKSRTELQKYIQEEGYFRKLSGGSQYLNQSLVEKLLLVAFYALEGISKPVVDFARSPSSLSKQREFWRIPLR